MWLNVLQAKSTSQQCWSAVFPTVLGVASPMLLAGAPCDLYQQLLADQIVTVPGGGPSQGCHGLYLLPCARALPGSANFGGTSAQAHLLVISLTTTYVHCTCTVEPFVMLLKSVLKLSVKKITNIFLGCQQNCWL